MHKLCFVLSFVVFTFTNCSNGKHPEAPVGEKINIEDPKDKIWAHRVNSLTNIQERINDFKGIEIDIFYNHSDNMFVVKHDVNEEGVDLEYFLDSILKIKKVLFWFDYKNLNENTDSGILKLNEILIGRKLDKSSFVESYYGNLLEKFNGKVATSFWISAKKIPESKEQKEQFFKEKHFNLQDLNVSMFSAHYKWFDYLTTYFPNHKCNYWMSGSLSAKQLSILNKMAQSPNVNVILIDGNENLLN